MVVSLNCVEASGVLMDVQIVGHSFVAAVEDDTLPTNDCADPVDLMTYKCAPVRRADFATAALVTLFEIHAAAVVVHAEIVVVD